jgi:uncharacterized membrane protein
MNGIQPTENSSNNLNGNIPDAIAGRYDFKIMDIIREAWQKVKGVKASYWGAFLLLMIFSFAAFFLLFMVGDLIFNPQKKELLTEIASRITYAAIFPMITGIIMIGVNRAANLPFKATFVFKYYEFFLKLLLGLIIISLIFAALTTLLTFLIIFIIFLHKSGPLTFFTLTIEILLGLLAVLLAASLFYLYVGYTLFSPLIVEKKLTAWRALEASRKSVSHHFFKILGLYFLLTLILLVSIIPAGIGLIWSAPLINNSFGVLYRRMFGVNGNASSQMSGVRSEI